MAMTKNIRTTVNAVSKLFALNQEAYKRMDAVKHAETANEAIEAAKALNSFSKRVDRLCAKLGFDRDLVDEVYNFADGSEDAFVLHILSSADNAFSAYHACLVSETVEDADFMANDEPAEGYPDAPHIAPAE